MVIFSKLSIITLLLNFGDPDHRFLPEPKIQTKAESTQRNFREVIKNFDTFCAKQYQISGEKIISEYLKAKEGQIYDSLQDWINWNSKRGISANTIPMWFSYLKKYLRYHKVRINNEDASESLDFPHKIREERYPLIRDEIKKILEVSNHDNKLRILAQTSSGLRRGELLQLQKKDLDITRQRIVVNVPAKITKTKKSRVTFFSIEVQRILIPRLKNLNDDDKIFSYSNIKLRNIGDSYQQAIIRYLKKTGLAQKYSAGRYKITTHSFRAFFITKVSRHDPNLAKYFAGQEQSRDLLVYDRLTLDEKLQKYIEFELDLLMYTNVR